MSWQSEAEGFIKQVSETVTAQVQDQVRLRNAIEKQCEEISKKDEEKLKICREVLFEKFQGATAEYMKSVDPLPIKIAQCFKESNGNIQAIHECKKNARSELRVLLANFGNKI